MAFINQNDQEDQNEQTPATSNPVSTGPSGAPAPMSANTPVAQPKGSGRFTNIQKYIGANQGAGERLAGGVGTKINSQINPAVKKTEDSLGSVRDGIQAGRGLLDQGNQLRTQVEDTNFDALGFASNEDNVNKFTNFRTGQAIDEAGLRTTAQNAQQQGLQASQTAQKLGNQFGSEQGRQALLKETFSPGRNYSVGQQRLDGLFMQQATPQIKEIQSGLSEAQKKLQATNSLLGAEAGNVDQLALDEQGLVTGLNTGIKARESDLLKSVEAKQGEVNAQRMAAQQGARDQFGNLIGGKEIDQDFANTLGLTGQDRLLNVLKNNGNIDDYLKFNETTLSGADQLANQQERMKYDAIARLAGIDPNQRQIKKDTVVKNAVDSTGKLRTSLDDRNKEFQTLLDSGKTATGVYNALGAYNTPIAVASDQLKNLTGQVDSIHSNGGLDKLVNANPYWLNGRYNAGMYAGDALVSDQIKNINANMNTNTSGVAGGGTVTLSPSRFDSAKNAARTQALMDAYRQLSREGYLQNVNIKKPQGT